MLQILRNKHKKATRHFVIGILCLNGYYNLTSVKISYFEYKNISQQKAIKIEKSTNRRAFG